MTLLEGAVTAAYKTHHSIAQQWCTEDEVLQEHLKYMKRSPLAQLWSGQMKSGGGENWTSGKTNVNVTTNKTNLSSAWSTYKSDSFPTSLCSEFSFCHFFPNYRDAIKQAGQGGWVTSSPILADVSKCWFLLISGHNESPVPSVCVPPRGCGRRIERGRESPPVKFPIVDLVVDQRYLMADVQAAHRASKSTQAHTCCANCWSRCAIVHMPWTLYLKMCTLLV